MAQEDYRSAPAVCCDLFQRVLLAFELRWGGGEGGGEGGGGEGKGRGMEVNIQGLKDTDFINF